MDYVTSTRNADYYRVAAKTPVTVRRSMRHRVSACLTCLKTDCEHVDAVEQYAAENPVKTDDGDTDR